MSISLIVLTILVIVFFTGAIGIANKRAQKEDPNLEWSTVTSWIYFIRYVIMGLMAALVLWYLYELYLSSYITEALSVAYILPFFSKKIVIQDKGEDIASAYTGRKQGHIYIWDFSIYWMYRGQRISYLLMDAVLDYWNDVNNNVECTYRLNVEENNKIAIHAYKQYGFKVKGLEEVQDKMTYIMELHYKPKQTEHESN